MQSLICKTLQIFVCDRHGEHVWQAAVRRGGLEEIRFEAFQRYRPETILALHDAVSGELGLPIDALMEDLGIWVCTSPKVEAVRRLIRFSGETFEDMLFALDGTQDRVNLAMPGLDVPKLALTEQGEGQFLVTCTANLPGAGPFFLGALRAMADDYGALALVDLVDSQTDANGRNQDSISVQLLARNFATPRDFRLGGVA